MKLLRVAMLTTFIAALMSITGFAASQETINLDTLMGDIFLKEEASDTKVSYDGGTTYMSYSTLTINGGSSASTYRIFVESGTHSITLNGVKFATTTESPLKLSAGSTVNLHLLGENIFTSNGAFSVINGTSTSNLNITGNYGSLALNGLNAVSINGDLVGNITTQTPILMLAGDTSANMNVAASIVDFRYFQFAKIDFNIVNYIDANGNATNTNADSVSENSVITPITNQTTLSAGWYVVDASTTIPSRITVNGDVHIILKDGFTLTANEGIQVTQGNSLTIYGETTAHSGKLVANATGLGCPAIGVRDDNTNSGGPITINGGTIEATAEDYAPGIGGGETTGAITINGGYVTATGAEGPGIGGYVENAVSSITINGGTVTANTPTAGGSSAIGTARDGSLLGTITITGGNVTANGSDLGSGIGLGNQATGGTIVISGGTVNAIKPAGGTGYGIGQGKNVSGTAPTFSTTAAGTAVIKTFNGIDESDKANWKGLIMIDNNGAAYSNVTLTENLTIDASGTFEVKNNVTVTMGNSTSISNNGIVINYGIIEGVGVFTNHATAYAVGGTYPAGVNGVTTLSSTGFNLSAGNIKFRVDAGVPQYSIDGTIYFNYDSSNFTITASAVAANNIEVVSGTHSISVDGVETATSAEAPLIVGDNSVLNLSVIGSNKFDATGSTAAITLGTNSQLNISGTAGAAEASIEFSSLSSTAYNGMGTMNISPATNGKELMVKGGDNNIMATVLTDYSTLYTHKYLGVTYFTHALIDYIGANGNLLNTNTDTVAENAIVTPITNQTSLTAGWYIVDSSVTIADRIEVSGDVHIILKDGATLTAPKGIGVNGFSNLTIYGQSAHSGAIAIATPDTGNAGIGGTMGNSTGNITINGGTITTSGGNGASGIGSGGGETAASFVITINNGIIEATGPAIVAGVGDPSGSAAIGGGQGSTGGTVNINGGYIWARGPFGIGNDSSGSGTSVSISGNAFVDAEAVSDLSGQASWSGVVFTGNAGQVYGNPTLTQNAKIQAHKTLTVPAGTTLTIGTGKSLTNDGTLLNHGTISGTVFGTVIIPSTITIKAGNTFTTANNSSLILNKGITLVIEQGATLVSDGVLMVNEGATLRNLGTIIAATADNVVISGTFEGNEIQTR